MPATLDHLIERLQSEGEKTAQFFSGFASDDWQRTVYTDGAQWTARQVLAHLVASELSMARLVENIRSGGSGSPEDFRLNEYNERRVSRLEGIPPGELLQQYRAARAATVELVREMVPAELSLTGRHPFLGTATLEDIIKIMYRHNQIHQREIRLALGKLDEAVGG